MVGMRYLVDPNVPDTHIGDNLKPIMPHPIIIWLWKLFDRPVYPVCFVRGTPILEPGVYLFRGDTIILSRLAASILKEKGKFDEVIDAKLLYDHPMKPTWYNPTPLDTARRPFCTYDADMKFHYTPEEFDQNVRYHSMRFEKLVVQPMMKSIFDTKVC